MPTHYKIMDNLDSPKPSLSDFKILVAEDNLVNQKVAKRVLTHLGYEVDIVNNGLEAIRAIADKSYDLILMDIQMPEMDGLETTRYIRKQESELQLPSIAIVAMTANATDDDQNVCRDAGMSDYIGKPIQIDKLKSILQRYAALKKQK
jgi:CheY-like chemotaxis protein